MSRSGLAYMSKPGSKPDMQSRQTSSTGMTELALHNYYSQSAIQLYIFFMVLQKIKLSNN